MSDVLFELKCAMNISCYTKQECEKKYLPNFWLQLPFNMYLAREKRSCSAIVRKTISYEWDISRDGQSILFQMLEQ